MKGKKNILKCNKNHENTNNSQMSRRPHLEHWMVIAFYLVIYDVIAVNLSYFLGLLLRFDFQFSNIPQNYLVSFLKFAPFYTAFCLVAFYALHLYNSLWRFASFNELNRILIATILTTAFQVLGITGFCGRMPGSYYVFGCLLQFCLLTVVRFGFRYISLERVKRAQNEKAIHNAMIIGAGAAGRVIVRELKTSPESDARPCCIIDDNSNKWGRTPWREFRS